MTATPIGCALTQRRVPGQRMIAVKAGNSPPQQSRAVAASDGSWKMNHDGR
jgi:hypothetical protein